MYCSAPHSSRTSLRDKGRVNFPSKLREDMGDRFILAKGLDGCLCAYSLEEWTRLEEKIKSVDYDVWVCDTCGEVDVFPFFNKNTPYRECPVCHAKAATLVGDRLIRRPTALKEGEGMKTYKCRNCGNTANVPYVIPADDVPVIVPFIGGFGSGRGGGFGGGFGGSFGGGSTGGGGASGGW